MLDYATAEQWVRRQEHHSRVLGPAIGKLEPGRDLKVKFPGHRLYKKSETAHHLMSYLPFSNTWRGFAEQQLFFVEQSSGIWFSITHPRYPRDDVKHNGPGQPAPNQRPIRDLLLRDGGCALILNRYSVQDDDEQIRGIVVRQSDDGNGATSPQELKVEVEYYVAVKRLNPTHMIFYSKVKEIAREYEEFDDVRRLESIKDRTSSGFREEVKKLRESAKLQMRVRVAKDPGFAKAAMEVHPQILRGPLLIVCW